MDKQNPEFTFIIPAYNAQCSIDSCINSIEEDVNSECVEILVAENGSTDKTSQCIEKHFTDVKVEIRLLHSCKGVSNARNLGLEQARGEYVIFLDADDLWLKGSLAAIERKINRFKPDILVCGFVRGNRLQPTDECEKIIHKCPLGQFSDTSDAVEQMAAWLISAPTKRMQAWAKVYRTNWLRENALLFNPELRYSEDSEFVLRGLLKANKIAVLEKAVMHYTISQGSAMHSIDEQRTEQYIRSLQCSEKEIQKQSAQIRDAFDSYVLAHLNLILVHDIYEMKISASWRERREKLDYVLQESIFQNALKRINLKECLVPQLFPEFLLKLHLKNLTGAICGMRSWINSKKANT